MISLLSSAADPSSLDTFMILTDANGTEIARNDDNVFAEDVAERLNSAIFFQPLPHDGFYSVLISRFGRGEGDYVLELRLEARGDTKIERLYLGTLDPRSTFGQLANGDGIALLAVGDWVAVSGEPDVGVAAFLTFVLPILDAEERVRSGLLDLTSCLIRGANLFEAVGSVKVMVNDTFHDISEIRAQPNADARQVTTASDCEIVDVTGAVENAYATDQGVLQLLLVIEDESLLGNGVADAVVFPYPRLEITIDQNDLSPSATG